MRVSRKAPGATVGDAPASVDSVLRSPGQPLGSSARAFFEPRFGRDLSQVRIHTDREAQQSAREVKALAYTVGSHVVFDAGRYEPYSRDGVRLLAHELTHVVQQGQTQGVQRYKTPDPEGEFEQPPSRIEAAMATDSGLPSLADVSTSLQRQAGDPLEDPLGEQTPKADPATERADMACGSPTGKFMWVEVAPDVFVILNDDTVKMSSPEVSTGGCTPGRPGNVGLFSGKPAWQMPTNCDTCTATGPGSKAGSTAGIKIGYIQTVENCLSGGVYFREAAPGQWVWAGNNWVCVKNARDGFSTSTPPWYGPDDKGNFGPETFGTCPGLADHPFVVLPSRQGATTKAGVARGGNPLRRMRIDGIFHIWLVAQSANGPLVFIHNWTIECWVVATLNDDADPCNRTGWQKFDMKTVKSSGAGKGSASPVLTGQTANELKQPC